jgi:hypothetical protein
MPAVNAASALLRFKLYHFIFKNGKGPDYFGALKRKLSAFPDLKYFWSGRSS